MTPPREKNLPRQTGKQPFLRNSLLFKEGFFSPSLRKNLV